MYRKLFHLLILPLLLSMIVSGCLQADAVQLQNRQLGGITILKTDIGGNPLPGAVFRIAREASWEELMNPDIDKALLQVEDTHLTVVYESFRVEKKQDAPRVLQAVTGSEGKVSLHDLPWGTHYLVEETAPEGYRRMTQPVRIRVHKYSHLTREDLVYDDSGNLMDNTIHIINVRYSLPETGQSDGPVLLAGITGILCSAASLIAMVLRKVG